MSDKENRGFTEEKVDALIEQEDRIDPALSDQITALSERVHDLLDGPDGDGQDTGNMDIQRVTLDVPRAFVVLATYLATFEAKKNKPSDIWQHDFEEGAEIDGKIARQFMRRYLATTLYNAMHLDLHWLATHRFRTEASPNEGTVNINIKTGQQDSGNPDQDEDEDEDEDFPY